MHRSRELDSSGSGTVAVANVAFASQAMDWSDGYAIVVRPIAALGPLLVSTVPAYARH